MTNREKIKGYFKNSYEFMVNPEEAYQYNFGYIEGFNDAKGFSKEEYDDLNNYNKSLLRKEGSHDND